MSNILQITGSPVFDDNIVRKEFRTFHPYIENFNNNDEIRIAIQNQDLIVLPSQSYLYFQIKFETSNVDKNKVLVNNFISFLFDEIRYELNGVEIDKTKNLGYTSTMKNIMTINPNEASRMASNGWYVTDDDKPTDPIFDICVPLKRWMGFCDDYRKIIPNMRHEIILVRSKNNNNTVKVSAETETFEIIIQKLNWQVPIIQLSDVNKLQLMKVINSNKNIYMPFRSWELYEYPVLPASNRHIWNVMTSTALERPRHVIIGLQTEKRNKVLKDNSTFDNCNLTSLRLYLNSVPYPAEEIKINFDGKYSMLYEMYRKFGINYYNDENFIPYLSQHKYKDIGALVYIDCSNQEESLKTGTVDVTVALETSLNKFPDNCTVFCLVIHDKIMEYNPLTSVVGRIA